MKIQFIGILFGLSLLMLLCIVGAFKDKRKLAVDVRGLLLAAVIPMAGNILVAVSKQIWLCNIGYLMYFFGVDLVFYFLVRYSMSYCSYEFDGTALKKILITVKRELLENGFAVLTAEARFSAPPEEKGDYAPELLSVARGRFSVWSSGAETDGGDGETGLQRI